VIRTVGSEPFVDVLAFGQRHRETQIARTQGRLGVALDGLAGAVLAELLFLLDLVGLALLPIKRPRSLVCEYRRTLRSSDGCVVVTESPTYVNQELIVVD